MNIEEGIKHAIDGNAIVFLGAGFSRGAINLKGSKMRLASELSNDLCDELGMPRDSNLSKVSNIYLDANDSYVLVDKLFDEFKCKKVETYHEVIASLPWKRIYTTNYDNTFECASINSGRRIRSCTISDNIRNMSKSNIIFHINGYIERLNVETLNNEFKLTSQSYLVEDFIKTDWAALFKSDIRNSKAVFFIGCSFDYDLDLQRIINNSPDINEKIIFIDKILDEKEKQNKYYNYYKELFGTVENIGVEEYSKVIERVSKQYKAKTQVIKFNCFKLVNEQKNDFNQITTQDIWDLLSFGRIKDNLVYYDNESQYLISRNVVSNIKNSIKDDNPRIIIIHSDLGNGKTCIVEKLKYELIELGKVFKLDKQLDYITLEIDKIDQFEGKKFIIIENYNQYFTILNEFKQYVNDKYCFILTARSYINDSVSYKLGETLGISESDIIEFPVNNIEDIDINKTIGLLDKTEVWKEKKGMPSSIKRKEIIKTYGRNFREIVLDLMNTSSVSDRVIELYNDIEKSEISKEILLAVLINSIIGLNMTLEEVLLYLSINSIPNNIKKNESFNELIDMSNYEIKCKSPILAKFLIDNQNLEIDLIQVIKKMNYNANQNLFDISSIKLRKALISISNIWQLVDKKQRTKSQNIEAEVLQYYDSVKDFPEYQSNPYFWLQYAIACLDIRQYSRAKNYFDIAYREGEKKEEINYLYEFDTFQIDTQYSRYLFENYLFKEEADSPIGIMKEAHRLLMNTLKSSRSQKHYVFRQVIYYHKFFKKYQSRFTNEEKNTVIKYCTEMKQKIEESLLNERDREQKRKKEIRLSDLENCIERVYKSVTS